MKKTIHMRNLILYLAFLTLTMVSCKEEDDARVPDCGFTFSASYNSNDANPQPAKYPCDYLTAKKNGSDWTVYAQTDYLESGDTLVIRGLGNEESFGVKIPFTGTGTYLINRVGDPHYFRANAFYYSTIGGDVITSYYEIDGTGTVEVTEYNVIEKLIKGHFHMTLKKQTGSSGQDELTFDNGEFSVHLPD